MIGETAGRVWCALVRARRAVMRVVCSIRGLAVAGAIMLVLSASLSSWTVYAMAHRSCEQRTQGRADTRAAIRGAVDEVASYAHLDESQRRDLLDDVTRRAMRDLPAPRC